MGSPLTVTDVAIELSPRLKDANDTRNKLFKEAREAKEERQRWGRARDANMKAQTHRLAEMGAVRRFLHRNGLKPDKILAEHERGDAEAQTELAKLCVAGDQRRPLIEQVNAEHKEALSEVLDRAEKELSRRISVASDARHRLREHYEAEKEVSRKPRLAQWQERPMDESGQPLFERYKAERDTAYAERQAAEKEVYDRFAAFEQESRDFYNARVEREKGVVQHGHARHDAVEILKAMQRGDRVEVRMLRDQHLLEARRAHPLPDWESWLKKEAERGEPEAVRAVEQRQARARQHGLER